MNIKVWSGFSKRKNSTKQPSGGTQISVRLKDNCSVEAPVFILTGGLPDYNYVEAFGHYYFVSDIVSLTADVSEIHCTQDVLATYKSDIGNTSAFVMYDETSNTTITDARLATVKNCVTASNYNTLSSHISTTGMFIATVTGQASTQSYVISASDVIKLIPDIQTQIENVFPTATGVLDADFVPTIIAAIKQIITAGHVAENIRDVRWVPVSASGINPRHIYAGMYDTNIVAGIVPMSPGSRLLTDTKVINIPWQFSDWRNMEPYTQLMAYIPFVGVVGLPTAALQSESSINFKTSIDVVTGDMAVSLETGALHIGTYGATIGCEIPIGNAAPVLSNLVTTMASIPTMMAGGVVGVATGVANAASNMFTPLTQTVGGISSAAGCGLSLNASVTAITHNTSVAPSSVASVMGTPSFTVKQISTLSGYVKCLDASVSTSAKDPDREIINTYLNEGFFYE